MTTRFDVQVSPPGGWRMLNNSRLPPIPRKEAGLVSRMLMWAVERFSKNDAANLLLMMKRNPRMLRGMMSFASKLMPFGELDRKDTELVILRVAWNCRSRYEWGQHVNIGLRVGLTVDDIARIASGPEAPDWSGKQASLLKACDEFHHERFVSDTTWQQLAHHFNERLLLELLFLIGFYEGLAGVLNSTGLPLDAVMEMKLKSLEIHKN